MKGLEIKKVLKAQEVSNPWREAIEAGITVLKGPDLSLFPILGGRLLKKEKVIYMHLEPNVSNPWREAIEVVRATIA